MATETGTEDETSVTFVLDKEDHTLGNSLRYMVMKKWVKIMEHFVFVFKLFSDRFIYQVAK